MTHFFSAAMIIIGGIIMGLSLWESRKLLVMIPFLPENKQLPLTKKIHLLQGLMLFFLLGYGIVAISFISRINILGELFVGVVFFGGAVFVLISNRIQTKMLIEAKNTLSGLLPICSSCKKMRSQNSDPKNQASWQPLEVFISDRTSADFTHSICPECLKKNFPEQADRILNKTR
ncbi:hypothetical protein SAMN02745165_02300 [Malonomonas rubra DSM 5091]|uniref:Uncharacterized protein n=1 Tax=Malonomonas rubra DSM 5091 TaxID=1122189 RepID=A0A1M6IZC4_MALRU|nr:hypothetical protein [Malonomonas rubra]SHJ39692.1 hypothetical protein SAMN02745165_02300 [Malonomonas rubra DSM 5091]